MVEIPASHQDLLYTTAMASMATIGPKGEPQVNPVLFGWDGTHLYFTMNAIRQKHKNIVREPRIALSITDPANAYRSLEIRGRVVRIEDDSTYRIASALTQKYTGEDAISHMQGEQRVAVFVEPERVFTFPFAEKQ